MNPKKPTTKEMLEDPNRAYAGMVQDAFDDKIVTAFTKGTTGMKQSRELPPNWTELQEAFGVEWGQVCVTYGDTVYSAREVSDDIMAHEEVHAKRQGNDPAAWWKRYMTDPDFRKQEEILGYKAQMKFIKNMTTDRNRLFNAKDNIARAMSGTIYGKCMNYHEAMACLK